MLLRPVSANDIKRNGRVMARNSGPSKKYLAGSFVAVSVARIFSLAAAVFQVPILTRLLPPAEYGHLAAAIAGATYVTLFLAEPHILAFQRLPGFKENRFNYRFASQRMYFSLLLGIIVILAVGYGIGYTSLAFALTGWGVSIASVRMVSTAALAWSEPWRYSLQLMVSTGSRTATLLVLISHQVPALEAVAWAGFLSAGMTLLVGARWSKKYITESPDPPWSPSFGVHLAIGSLSNTVLSNFGIIAMPALVIAEDAGRFAAMTQISSYGVSAVLGLIGTVLYPIFRAGWDADRKNQVRHKLEAWRWGQLFIACCAIFIFGLGHSWLPRLAVGELYVDERILPVLLLSAGLTSMALNTNWERQFVFDVKYISVATTISAVVGVLLIVAGALTYGVVGAAVARILGSFAYLLIMRGKLVKNHLFIVAVILGIVFALLFGPLMVQSRVVLFSFLIFTLLVGMKGFVTVRK